MRRIDWAAVYVFTSVLAALGIVAFYVLSFLGAFE